MSPQFTTSLPCLQVLIISSSTRKLGRLLRLPFFLQLQPPSRLLTPFQSPYFFTIPAASGHSDRVCDIHTVATQTTTEWRRLSSHISLNLFKNSLTLCSPSFILYPSAPYKVHPSSVFATPSLCWSSSAHPPRQKETCPKLKESSDLWWVTVNSTQSRIACKRASVRSHLGWVGLRACLRGVGRPL